MNFLCCNHGSFLHARPNILVIKAVEVTKSTAKSLETADGRLRFLQRVDDELRKRDERGALSLVKELQGVPGGLRCFGAARQVGVCPLVSCCGLL